MTARPPIVVELDGVDVADAAIEGVTITFGRVRVSDPVNPATCQIRFVRSALPAGAAYLGVPVHVHVPTGPAAGDRFTGAATTVTVTDLWVTVTATSTALGALARTMVTDWSPAAERVGAAIGHIVDAAFAATTAPTVSIDTGYVTLDGTLAVGTMSGLAACQLVAANDIYGVLYETRAGVIRYEQYRSATAAALTLDAAYVSLDWSSSTDLPSIGNEQAVTYSTGTVKVRDSASIGDYGKWAMSRTMATTDVADAISGANAWLLAYGTPWPSLDGITVELTTLPSAATQADYIDINVGTVVDTSALAAVEGMPATCVVEGWTEVIGRESWQVTYQLSPLEQTLRPQVWSAVTPTRTWATVPAGTTWSDMITDTL